MRNEEILKRVIEEAKEIEIPESIMPEHMKKRLEAREETIQNSPRKSSWKKSLAAAACLCLVLGGSLFAWNRQMSVAEVPTEDAPQAVVISEETEAETSFGYPEITYEDIYASMQPVWEKQYFYTNMAEPQAEAPAEDRAEASIKVAASEAFMKQMNTAVDDFAGTNVQTAGIDEGDVIKNDGRYLYQIVDVETEKGFIQAIQITDTKDGLQKLCSLQEFENITEFYVWEDILIVIENKVQYEELVTAAKSRVMVDMICGADIGRTEWHEISFYDMKDRSQPKMIKTFTLQGRYASSRIADGYFYGFSRFYAKPGTGEADYEAYIPAVDGVRLQADQILLPEENTGSAYLVLVSVDLKDPTEFVQTTAVVSPAEQFYVSTDNIYITSSVYDEQTEGWNSNQTSIRKFSYGNGMFAYQTKTRIKGGLDDRFSLDEYDGHLRAVTTVQEYERKILTDDRTGETIGAEIVNDRQTNALYVLDENMNLVGSIEGLAEDEQIYSARFMGDTGYFVTFRQTDPLFAVDLSDPSEPKILSELKISGFSDYLHFYGEDRLLGIGMEADEETGRQEGMKLSMFDISDPTDVKEIAKLNLKDYDHSEALYNSKAVMISTSANIFGFEAEGYGKRYSRAYLVFSYEDDQFVKEMELDVKIDGGYHTTRGTFIGDTVYLLSRDGSVRSYDRESGKMIESLEK